MNSHFLRREHARNVPSLIFLKSCAKMKNRVPNSYHMFTNTKYSTAAICGHWTGVN